MNVVEYFTAFNQANLATVERLGRLSMETSEQLATLAMGYTRTAFEEAAKDAQSVAASKDFSEFYASRTKAAEQVMTKAQAFAKESYTVATAAQGEVSKVVEERVAAMHKVAVDFVDESSKTVPSGGEAAVAAMKSAVAASGVMFDTMTKVGRQAQGFVEAAAKASEKSVDNVKSFTATASKRK
jgi:phasin family protein